MIFKNRYLRYPVFVFRNTIRCGITLLGTCGKLPNAGVKKFGHQIFKDHEEESIFPSHDKRTDPTTS